MGRDLAVSTKNWYLHILRRYLAYFQNDVVEQVGVDFGQDVRPNVNWLSDEQAEQLMKMKKTPLEEVVIHLELCLGLRIVEVCRLRLSDIYFDEDPRKYYVSVRGKGKGDGKWRSIPFHPDSKEVFDCWITRRNEIITRMHEFDPSWKVPEEFLIWCHYENSPSAGRYTERGHSLDRAVIHKVRDHAGFEFSNHTLRRTLAAHSTVQVSRSRRSPSSTATTTSRRSSATSASTSMTWAPPWPGCTSTSTPGDDQVTSSNTVPEPKSGSGDHPFTNMN